MAENKLADLSIDFAINIIKLTEKTKGHYSITNQLERSATSVGANIREAKYAHSKADFVSKLQIALKECFESEYWLELLFETGYLEEKQYKKLNNDCGAIRKMLISSCKTLKEKK